MPIADLLGVQFDMQLLLKLSFSVAAALLISWAYRFYSSRNIGKTQLCSKDDKKPQNAACQSGEMTLRHQSSPEYGKNDGSKRTEPLYTDSASDDLPSDGAEGIPALLHQAERSEEAFSESKSDQDRWMKGERLADLDQPLVAISNTSFESAWSLQDAKDNGSANITGRRSPWFLEKLEGGVGVGRELEHQGAYSSFLSKAKIKVEDAKVVLEGSGDRVVRGKIYEYYVESSSHSVTDPSVLLGQYDRNDDSKQVEFGNHGGRFTECPSPVSPIIMSDLVLQRTTADENSWKRSVQPGRLARPALLRKESYLSATEDSEFSVTFQTSVSPSPVIRSPAPAARELVSLQTSRDGKQRKLNDKYDLETVAGTPFFHLPAEDLEDLKSKLDLGNCLETFYLAKKNGNLSLQRASLRVMSDNYLQVLKDPNLYGRLLAGEREQIQRQRMRGRKFVMVADMDPQDWLRDTERHKVTAEQKKTSSAVYYYDDHKDAWHALCLIPQEVISKACAMCTMDNYLFVALGCQGTDREVTPSKRVFCFNPLTSIWKEISPMNEARPRCKLAALEGYIYAIGGECLSSVERYDPRLDRWTFVAPLPNDTFAVAHHVTVCSGELFVSGGTLRCMLLRYNPRSNTWRPSLVVGSNDRTADLVAVGRFLYRFDVNPVLGVCVYRYHAVARLWYECSAKRLQRCPAFQCVAMDGTIYCLSRQFTMRFEADEVSPAFTDEGLSVLPAAKGILFPFVLTLPDKNPRQTSV